MGFTNVARPHDVAALIQEYRELAYQRSTLGRRVTPMDVNANPSINDAGQFNDPSFGE